MGWKQSNFVDTALLQAAGDADTVVYIDSVSADLLPSLGASDKAKGVIYDTLYREIVNITDVTDGALTVERGKESTSARAWPAGAKFVHTPTAEIFNSLLDAGSFVTYEGDLSNIGNDYTLTIPVSVEIPAFQGGEIASFVINETNTGNVTLTFTNGTDISSTKSILNQDGTELAPGDFQEGFLAMVRYNSSEDSWFLLTETAYNAYIAEINGGPIPAINRHPNGRFAYWRSGSSFLTPASGSETADGVFVEYDGAIGTFTVSRQPFVLGQTDVPDSPKYFYRWDQSVAGAASTIRRLRVPIWGVTWASGERVSRRIWIKAEAAHTVNLKLIQTFGTGGGPSADVVADTTACAVTTAWQMFEVSAILPALTGKTIGTADDALVLTMDIPLNITCTIDMAVDDIRQGRLQGLQSHTFPLPWWLGGVGGSFRDREGFLTYALLSSVLQDLAAIEALAGTSGGLYKTAANTWALRTLQDAAAGLTWTNPAGIAGNPTPVFSTPIVNYLADPLSVAELASITAAFGTAAFVNTGTSGATLGLLNANLTFSGTNAHSGAETFSSTIVLGGGATAQFNNPANTHTHRVYTNSSNVLNFDYDGGAVYLTVNSLGSFAFTTRPSFNGNTALDTNNGAALAGAAFTGACSIVNGGAAAVNLTVGTSQSIMTLSGGDGTDAIFNTTSSSWGFRFTANGAALLNITSLGDLVAKITNIGPSNDYSYGFRRYTPASITTGTLVVADSGKCVYATGAVTFPNSVFSKGDVVLVLALGSSRTLTQGSGVTMTNGNTGATGSITLGANGCAVAVYTSSSAVTVFGNV